MRITFPSIAVALLSIVLSSAALADDDTQSDAKAALDRGDYAAAAPLLKSLAAQGDVAAEYNLGVIYGNGQGVEKSDVQSASWFEKAARGGNAAAQFNIGVMYLNGQGVPPDPERAYMWLDVASSNLSGVEAAQATKYRDEIARRMTPDQLQDARDMVDNCKLAGVRNCD